MAGSIEKVLGFFPSGDAMARRMWCRRSVVLHLLMIILLEWYQDLSVFST
jgi:hypothetical protein